MSRRLSVLDLRSRNVERRFFDPGYYRRTYKDVAASRIDPFRHFMLHGWVEGRNPSAGFINLYYRDKHLAGASRNPLTHFATEGRRLDLDTAPADAEAYLAVQIAVSKPFFDPDPSASSAPDQAETMLARYLRRGAGADVAGGPLISVARYRMENSFIEAIDVSPLYHFASQFRLLATIAPDSAILVLNPDLQDGVASAVLEKQFDRDFYLAANASVKRAGVDPLRHYMKHGWREGRWPNADFDPAYYLSKNPVVAETDVEPFFHYLTVGARDGRRGSAKGDQPFPPMLAPADTAWDTLSGAVNLDAARCLVLMIAEDNEKTLASIHSLLATRTRTPFALVVLRTDAPDVRLERLVARDLVLQVDSVDAAEALLARAPGSAETPLLIMRGDILVHGDWLDRMMAHAEADLNLATLSPLGNDFGFGSYPVTGQANRMAMELSCSDMDRLAAVCNRGRVSVLPVGSAAFVLLTRTGRAALAAMPLHDILRARGLFPLIHKAGARHGLAEDVFVYRGDDPLDDRAADRNFVVRDPTYPVRVAAHRSADPGFFGRLRLDLARLARDLHGEDGPTSIVLFVYHGLSGGIVTFVTREERRLRDEGVAVVHLRVGVGSDWGVEIAGGATASVYVPNLAPTAYGQIESHLAEFLGWLKPSAIHVHSLVGFDWICAVDLMALICGSGIAYDFMLHDYSVVCHRHMLVTPRGVYCGLPDVETCRACVASDRSYPEAVDPALRRRAYADFLDGATAVLAPSEDIAARLRRSGATYPIRVVAHGEPAIAVPPPPRRDEAKGIEIVVFGAIGLHKGSEVILSLAKDAAARALPIRYHIVGYSNQTAAMLDAGVSESGTYHREAEALRVASALSPTFVLVPSIWPETHCYTLSLAFALGVEALVFDLGAQADRVRANSQGVVLPLRFIDDAPGLNDWIVARITPSSRMPFRARARRIS